MRLIDASAWVVCFPKRGGRARTYLGFARVGEYEEELVRYWKRVDCNSSEFILSMPKCNSITPLKICRPMRQQKNLGES
jgi:hypothetical protein